MAQAKQKAEPETNGHAGNPGEAEDNVTPINQANTELGELEPDPNYTPVYEIRKLHSGDTLKVFRWVRAASAEESIRNAAANGGEAAAMQELIYVLLGQVEDDVVPWLMEITGNKDTPHEELPPEAIIDMINDLSNDRGFLRVFKSAGRASQAWKRISSLFRIEPESQNGSE